MNKVPHTNETAKFQHIGGVTIPPGETRDVDASLLPGYRPSAAPEPAAPPDLLAELLNGSIKNILPELPWMSDDVLARAAALEDAGMKRKSLLEALAAENLRRLTAATLGGPVTSQQPDGGAPGGDGAPAGGTAEGAGTPAGGAAEPVGAPAPAAAASGPNDVRA